MMCADLLDGTLIFTRVAEKRSFPATAAELGVTPAAISWTIKRLEEPVGATLLARITRSVNLTEAGELFLETGPRRCCARRGGVRSGTEARV